MAILAAPQPSFSCFTKGTSSQMPERSAAGSTQQNPSSATAILAMPLNTVENLSHSNNDQYKDGHSHKNNDQIAITERAAGEIRLRLLHPRSEPRQFSVVQRGNCVLYLLRIHMRRPQSFVSLLRREELPDLFHILLPLRGGLHRCLLQFRGTDHVRGPFCQKVLRKRENRGQNESRGHSG